MRNSSSATSATRLSTCSACARPCTASPLGSGGAWPASRPWPDAAPAQGERPHNLPKELKMTLAYIKQLLTAGTTTKTRTKRRMKRALKKRTPRKRKTTRRKTSTKLWGTAVSIHTEVCSGRHLMGRKAIGPKKLFHYTSERVLGCTAGNEKNADVLFPLSVLRGTAHLCVL